MISVTRKSILTGVVRTKEIDISPEDLELVERTTVLVQDIAPHLSASDREFIISGATDQEWDAMFGEEPA